MLAANLDKGIVKAVHWAIIGRCFRGGDFLEENKHMAVFENSSP